MQAIIGSQAPPTITIDPHARRAKPISDHAPVVAVPDI
jgi:hypothetical protein